MKKLKTRLAILACIAVCLLPNRLSAQFDSTVQFYAPGVTLNEILDSLETDPLAGDSTEGGQRRRIQKLRAFWQDRVTENDNSGEVMFSQYYRALNDAVEEKLNGSEQKTTAGTDCIGKWECLGPYAFDNRQSEGYVNKVWVKPSSGPNHYILAATFGGLFRSTDGGVHWYNLTDNAPIVSGITNITSIAVDPNNYNNIYLGTSGDFYINRDLLGLWGFHGANLLKSTNGGTTWEREYIPLAGPNPQNLAGNQIVRVQGVYYSPGSTRMYAFAGNKLYTKLSSGTNWTEIPTNISSDAEWVDLEFIPGGSETHFFISSSVALSHPKAGVYEVNWNGSAWTVTRISTNAKNINAFVGEDNYLKMMMSIPNSSYIYIAAISDAASGSDGKIMRYSFSTGTWTVLGDAPEDDWIKCDIAVSPTLVPVTSGGPATNVCIYYGGWYPWQLFYDGTSITGDEIGEYGTLSWEVTHGDIRDIKIYSSSGTLNGDDDVVFFATDGGVSKKPAGRNVTTDGDHTTVDISGWGLVCTQFWGIATSEAGGLVSGGTFHDGAMTYEPKATPQWHNEYAVDASTAVFDRSDLTKAYVRENKLFWQIAESASGGGRAINSWGNNTSPPNTGNVDAPLFNTSNNTRFNGLTGLYQFSTGTWSLSGLSGLPNNKTIHAMTFKQEESTPVGYVLCNYDKNDLATRRIYYRNPTISTDFVPYPTSVGGTVIPVPFTDEKPMIDVTFDPLNPDRVWVSLGALNWENDARKRVIYSTDHGETWHDISQGLPKTLPVTAIKFQEGSSYVYAATDVGIYRADMSTFNPNSTDPTSRFNGSVNWVCYSQNFPLAYVTDLEINYCEGRLYAATYGRGVWFSHIWHTYEGEQTIKHQIGDMVPTPTVIIPTGNSTWNTSRYLTGTVRIPNNAHLTISGSGTTIYMPKNGAIIIEPGGKLTLDAAKITNACTYFWKGVITMGQAHLSQTAANQGTFIMKNGATIEHARVGATNWGESISDLSSSGGIVQIENSTFLNCRRGVAFAPYHREVTPKTRIDNISFINNTLFNVDPNYRAQDQGLDYEFAAHVTMSDVEGIKLRGNEYVYQVSSFDKGYGVLAWNAGFSVIPYCAAKPYDYLNCPAAVTRSRFYGVAEGVTSTSGGATAFNHLMVDYADFEKQAMGVYVGTVNHANIFHSTFDVGNAAVSTANCNCQKGIFTVDCNQFRIEENTFIGHSVAPLYGQNYGIWIQNSGPNANDIYKNTFTSLKWPVAVGRQNSINTSKPADDVGLQLLCNTFNARTGNEDIYVGNQPANWKGNGIRLSQGSAKSPTGNTFIGTAGGVLRGAVGGVINYYHVDPSAYAPPSGYMHELNTAGYISYVINQKSGVNSSCPSRPYQDPTVPETDRVNGRGTYKRDVEVDFVTHKGAWTTAKSTYAALVDGGDTEGLLDAIETADPHDPNPLFEMLSLVSPHISEEVFRALAQSGMMPLAMMMELYEDNPEVLRNAEFLEFLQSEELPEPIEVEELDLLQNWSLNSSDRSDYEADILDAYSEMMLSSKMLLTHIKMDSVGQDGDTLAYWLKQIPELWPRYDIVGMYLGLVQMESAEAALAEIPGDFTLTADQQDEYDTYVDVFALMAQIINENGNMYQLDSAQLDSFYVYAMRGHGKASGIALAIYKNGMGEPPTPCMEVEEENERSVLSQNSNNLIRRGSNSYVHVYPNPAKNFVNFLYKLPVLNGQAMLTITDINGRVIKQMEIKDKRGQAHWDTQNMQPGIYLYKVSDTKRNIQTGKITIAK